MLWMKSEWINYYYTYCFCRLLAGKTIFITGASRGIGKAIALKAAKDGANIIIAAKTTTPHPKLPGTIYTAAKEGIRLWVYSIACRYFIQLNIHISNIHILNSVVLSKWFWTKVPNTFFGAFYSQHLKSSDISKFVFFHPIKFEIVRFDSMYCEKKF